MISFERSVFFTEVDGGFIARLPSAYPFAPATNVFATAEQKIEILARMPATNALREGMLASALVTGAITLASAGLIWFKVVASDRMSMQPVEYAMLATAYMVLAFGLLAAWNLYRIRRLRPYLRTLPAVRGKLGFLESCMARLQAHSPGALRAFMIIDALFCLTAATDLPSPMAVVTIIFFGSFFALTLKAYRVKLSSFSTMQR